MANGRRRGEPGWLDVFSLLPWWMCLILAVASYFLIDWFAGQRPDARAVGKDAVGFVSLSFLRGLAMGAKYLLPIAFVIAAIISGVRARAYTLRVTEARSEPGWDPSAPTRAVMGRDLYDDWKHSRQTPDQKPAIDTSRWSLDLIRAIEWKRFELLCAGYFEELQFRAETARGGPDGGIDVRLFTDASRHPAIIVQCKAWRTVPVGVATVREMLGVMTAAGVKEAVIATSGTFTADARSFAMGREITLIDGEDLLGKLQDLAPERQRSLLEFSTNGDWWTPTCPSCGIGIRMTLRRSKEQGNYFWGCSTFPKCAATMKVGSLGA